MNKREGKSTLLQSGGIIQKGEPHELNPCAPGFEEQPPEETSRQAFLYQQSSAEFGEKYVSSSRLLNYVFILL